MYLIIVDEPHPRIKQESSKYRLIDHADLSVSEEQTERHKYRRQERTLM